MDEAQSWAGKLEAFLCVDPTQSLLAAVAALRRTGADFALVGSARHPVSLARTEQIAAMKGTDTPVMGIQEHLPPLLIVDGTPRGRDDISEIIGILDQTVAPGAVIADEGCAVGVLAREVLAEMLRREDPKMERGAALVVPAQTYVCRKCRPPKRRRPRDGGVAPLCDIFSHGPMDLER